MSRQDSLSIERRLEISRQEMDRTSRQISALCAEIAGQNPAAREERTMTTTITATAAGWGFPAPDQGGYALPAKDAQVGALHREFGRLG